MTLTATAPDLLPPEPFAMPHVAPTPATDPSRARFADHLVATDHGRVPAGAHQGETPVAEELFDLWCRCRQLDHHARTLLDTVAELAAGWITVYDGIHALQRRVLVDLGNPGWEDDVDVTAAVWNDVCRLIGHAPESTEALVGLLTVSGSIADPSTAHYDAELYDRFELERRLFGPHSDPAAQVCESCRPDLADENLRLRRRVDRLADALHSARCCVRAIAGGLATVPDSITQALTGDPA